MDLKASAVPCLCAKRVWGVGLMSGGAGLGERRTGGQLRRLRTSRACGWTDSE